MKWMIQAAKVVDPNSPHNGKIVDLLIENGIITRIAKKIEHKGKIYQAKNLHVSPGWFDMRVSFCDPGFEHREDIVSGLEAARKGGFTGVALAPGTEPPLSSKSQIEYVLNRAHKTGIELLPYGTISAQGKGEQLAELYDMHLAGAVAFSDDKSPVEKTALMSTAMLYARNFDGLIISFPHESSLCAKGQIHEGEISTSLGLKGLPALAEEVMVARDLYLAEYNDCPIHFTGISSRGSVELIRAAKKKGMQVTCDTYVHNILLTDNDLRDFDQNKKVLPPLRSEDHRKALIKALIDGTIDAVCSDHTPEDTERKKIEFEHAAFGMIGLESFFGVLLKATDKKLELSDLVEKIALAPRRILQQPIPTVDKGVHANLTLFDPDKTWKYERSESKSKSANSPFFGQTFRGSALALFRDGKLMECR